MEVQLNYFPLTKSQQEWQERIAGLAAEQIGPRAAEYDAKSQFPKESLDALRDAGLWALRVPKEYGGLGVDLLSTCIIVEEVS